MSKDIFAQESQILLEAKTHLNDEPIRVEIYADLVSNYGKLLRTTKKIIKQFQEENSPKRVNFQMFSSYVEEIKNKESYLNAIFEKLEINDIDLIDKAIIFLGIIELEQEKFPKEVTFDECIRLARKFSNPESYKFINACLDKFSKLN